MKTYKRIVGLVLIVSVLLSCVFVVNSSAEENENVVEHVTCVKEHFDWIQNGSVMLKDDEYGLYPVNEIGNCPYIEIIPHINV